LADITGGPPEADFVGINPLGNLNIASLNTGVFTLLYRSKNKPVEIIPTKPPAPVTTATPSGTLNIAATLDGHPWQGALNYTVSGAAALSGTAAPQSFTGLKDGYYYAAYVSGGPKNAQLKTTSLLSASIAGNTAGLSFDFVSVGTLTVNGLINNSPWSGNCRYTIDGPVHFSGDHVPFTFADVPLGQYTLTYVSGGPEGFIFNDIMPRTLKLTADAPDGIFKNRVYPHTVCCRIRD